MYVKAIVPQLNVKYVGDCALLRLLLNYVANQFHQLISSQLMVFQDWLFVDLLTFSYLLTLNATWGCFTCTVSCANCTRNYMIIYVYTKQICGMLMPPISQFMFLPQICRFCWNKLRTEGNGLCPACRQVCHCSPCRISQPWGGYYSLWINILSCHNSLEFSTFCFAGLQREPRGFQAADHGGDGSHQGGEEAERSGSSHFFERWLILDITN